MQKAYPEHYKALQQLNAKVAAWHVLHSPGEKIELPKVYIVDKLGVVHFVRGVFGSIGYIEIGDDMMKRNTPEEFAAAVAHEYGHATYKPAKWNARLSPEQDTARECHADRFSLLFSEAASLKGALKNTFEQAPKGMNIKDRLMFEWAKVFSLIPSLEKRQALADHPIIASKEHTSIEFDKQCNIIRVGQPSTAEQSVAK